MDPRTDFELLSAIQASADRAAFATLYDRYSRKIYALSYGILRNTSDAEDVLQEVFETVWKKVATYQSQLGEPKYWMLRIAHNRSINHLKARSIRTPNILDGIVGVPEDFMGETINQGGEDVPDFDIPGILQGALSSLAPDQRRLIELAFFKGLSHSEIAENEQLPLGTVKTRIRSGIMRLRSELDFLKN